MWRDPSVGCSLGVVVWRAEMLASLYRDILVSKRERRKSYINSFLAETGKFWAMIGTLLYTFGSRERHSEPTVCLLVGCLTSQQHASVSQGRICSDNFTCCHTDIEVADQTFYLTQSQYTDTGPTSPSADPITPGAWQGSHWSANF